MVPVHMSKVSRFPSTCPVSNSTHRLIGSAFTPHKCLQLLAWFVCAWCTWCALLSIGPFHCRGWPKVGVLPTALCTSARVLSFRAPVWVLGCMGVDVSSCRCMCVCVWFVFTLLIVWGWVYLGLLPWWLRVELSTRAPSASSSSWRGSRLSCR